MFHIKCSSCYRKLIDGSFFVNGKPLCLHCYEAYIKYLEKSYGVQNNQQ